MTTPESTLHTPDHSITLDALRLPSALDLKPRQLLSPEMQALHGRVASFNPTRKEIEVVPLETRYKEWLTAALAPICFERWRIAPQEAVRQALTEIPFESSRWEIVGPIKLPDEAITAHYYDHASGLKRLAMITGTPGIIAFLSSPDLDREYHDRVWSYALGWPAHTELANGILEDRVVREHRSGEAPPKLPETRWRYEGHRFEGSTGAEYVLHLLIGSPRPITPELAPFFEREAGNRRALKIEAYAENVYLQQKLGRIFNRSIEDRRLVQDALFKLAEFFKGERQNVEPFAHFLQRHSIHAATAAYYFSKLPPDIQRDFARASQKNR